MLLKANSETYQQLAILMGRIQGPWSGTQTFDRKGGFVSILDLNGEPFTTINGGTEETKVIANAALTLSTTVSKQVSGNPAVDTEGLSARITEEDGVPNLMAGGFKWTSDDIHILCIFENDAYAGNPMTIMKIACSDSETAAKVAELLNG